MEAALVATAMSLISRSALSIWLSSMRRPWLLRTRKSCSMSRRALSSQRYRLELAVERLHGLENQLAALNPAAVLGRGYAVVMKKGKVVSSTGQVKVDDDLIVRVKDGEFDARVTGMDGEHGKG